MVFDGRFKLIRGYGGQPLLFDMDEDPSQNSDLFEKLPATRSRLAEILDRVS